MCLGIHNENVLSYYLCETTQYGNMVGSKKMQKGYFIVSSVKQQQPSTIVHYSSREIALPDEKLSTCSRREGLQFLTESLRNIKEEDIKLLTDLGKQQMQQPQNQRKQSRSGDEVDTDDEDEMNDEDEEDDISQKKKIKNN